jgi:hypothetical protein
MMAGDLFGQNQAESLKIDWKDSQYRFTEPVRYFKSNDPYYWEVDNIPVKQLEENILWLKDQLASFEISGVSRQHLAELKPHAVGGRTVRINPGKFMGRVNDAYQKGISSLLKTTFATIADETDVATNRIANFGTSLGVLKSIAGDVINNPIYNNGLYETVQHHEVNPYGGNSLEWAGYLPPITQDFSNQMLAIPKNKLSRWRQSFTSATNIETLTQKATEFARRWGGIARTALVNVTNQIGIDIPPFSDSDFANHTESSPAVRFDLLFLYTHPVDSPSTAITKPSGTGPTVITAPRLGIVKGAGVVNLLGQGAFNGYDSENDPDFFDSIQFTQSLNDATAFFNQGFSIDTSSDEYQMMTTISDQYQENTSINGYFGNFPSPDDLMNLTPLLQEDLESDSPLLIGQTVLPLAYIIVKKGASQITNEDIIDIRPFMRTAELSYNERSGIAGAFPPLSLANPAVGKEELNTAIVKTTNYLKQYVESIVLQSTEDEEIIELGAPIAKGQILGGTRYGVEGALLYISARDGDAIISNDNEALGVLRDRWGYKGLDSEYVPLYPGWDVAPWSQSNFTTGTTPGQLRNDCIHDIVQVGPSPEISDLNYQTQEVFLNTIADPDMGKSYYTNKAALNADEVSFTDSSQNISTYFGWVYRSYGLQYNTQTYDFDDYYAGSQYEAERDAWINTALSRFSFVKKTITVNVPANVVDYTVNAEFNNCFMLSPDLPKTLPIMKPGYGGQIFVEKGAIVGGEAKFTIFVAIPNNGLHSGQILAPGVDEQVRSDKNPYAHVGVMSTTNVKQTNIGDEYQDRTKMAVTEPNADGTSYIIRKNKTYDSENLPSATGSPVIVVTYPTVNFEVIGYQNVGQTFWTHPNVENGLL